MILGLAGKQASTIYFIALPYVRGCILTIIHVRGVKPYPTLNPF